MPRPGASDAGVRRGFGELGLDGPADDGGEWPAKGRKTVRDGRRGGRLDSRGGEQRRISGGHKSSRRADFADAGMDFTRKLYAIQFDNVAGEKLGETSALSRALDAATVALAAEMVGGMQRTLDITVEYAKTRKQFGKPIGIFQAVQHQCADMYLETESARSAVYYAAWALQERAADAAAAVSIAKIYASDAARTVGNRGIQLHGGMGFTWENDLHLYYRRAKASETFLGDATYHRERLARLVIDAGAVTAQSA